MNNFDQGYYDRKRCSLGITWLRTYWSAQISNKNRILAWSALQPGCFISTTKTVRFYDCIQNYGCFGGFYGFIDSRRELNSSYRTPYISTVLEARPPCFLFFITWSRMKADFATLLLISLFLIRARHLDCRQYLLTNTQNSRELWEPSNLL